MPQSIRFRSLLLVPAFAVLLGLTACSTDSDDAATYNTVRPLYGPIAAQFIASGSLGAVVTVTVGTPVSGIIKSLSADFNSPVTKGQIIAQIDPDSYRAQVDQTYGNYLSAKANLAKARVTLEDALRTLHRYSRLIRDGAVSQSDCDNAKTTADSARAALEAAEGSLAQAKGAYDQAKTNLDYTTIRSPLTGIVISRNVDVGQTVAANFQTPTLFVIAQDLRKMQILASVNEADIGKVHEGDAVTFTVDAYPDRPFPGVIAQIRNAATTVSNVVTYTVVINADNEDLRLKPGMTASVTFVTSHADRALIVPTAAFRVRINQAKGEEGAKPRPGTKRLYVLRQGRPVPVDVTIGIESETATEITGGLSPADSVIVGHVAPAGKPSSTGLSLPGPRF